VPPDTNPADIVLVFGRVDYMLVTVLSAQYLPQIDREIT
jgi:hypothetical protein